MTDAVMVKTIYLKAPREVVWDYLTKPDRLARWFHESDVELTEGSDYQLLRENPSEQGRKLCWGTVREADKPNRLVYTFTHAWLEGVESLVEWILIEVEGGTQLVMTHTGLGVGKDPFGMIADHDKGWDEHFQRLRAVASTY